MEPLTHLPWPLWHLKSRHFVLCSSDTALQKLFVLLSFTLQSHTRLSLHLFLFAIKEVSSGSSLYNVISISSIQFSHTVMSDSYWLQHARPPCSSPTPGVNSNSCPLSQWCYPTISSSVVPFSCLQSFPEPGSFQMSQFIASGGQNIGVSPLSSVLPMNIQDGFPLGWTGWISLLSKGLSRVFSNTTVQKHQFFCTHLSLYSNSHIHHDYWKDHSLD